METTELLKQLIQIQSPSGQEQALADFLMERLKNMGMETSRDRHGNIYGSYEFTSGKWGAPGTGPVILFNTHLDNVPVGQGWEIDPFEGLCTEGVIYGRGACDPKGAMAAMIGAAEALIGQDKGGQGSYLGRLIFMGAVTEEISPPSAKGTWKAVKDGLLKADMAICGEPTENLPCIGEFGKLEYELVVLGKSAHASAPEQGVNGILHLCRLLLALDEKAERRWSPLLGRSGTLNVGLVSGGSQINIVPGEARAAIERRLVPGQTAEESMAELRGICHGVKEQYPDIEYRLQVTGEGNAALISQEEPVAKWMAESVEAVTGTAPGARGFVAHADADWLITGANIPTVIFGPGALAHAHTCREQVKVKEVEEAAEILLVFLQKAMGAQDSSSCQKSMEKLTKL